MSGAASGRSPGRIDLVVHPCRAPLRGEIRLPSDKSIAHRLLILGALSEGESVLRGVRLGEDHRATMRCLRALGVSVEESEGVVRVRGVGIGGLSAPRSPLDCGNSGTTMRLLAGVLAAQPFRSVLTGDSSLSRRPMRRIVEPLSARGARVSGTSHPAREGEVTAPLTFDPVPAPERLAGLSWESPIPSAQVKGAVLLSGLFAREPTYFREPVVSRDHTERLLFTLGVPLRSAGPIIELDPTTWSRKLPPLDTGIVGDLSAAAFLIAAAQLVAESRVVAYGVGVNPTRAGFLEIAREMRASLRVDASGERGGEPEATLRAGSGSLVGLKLGGELVARAVDEVPIICALAARAGGTTTLLDAGELRLKETDRLAAVARMLGAFGVACRELPDGLVIEGHPGPLPGADVDSEGDHRIAMTAAVLALAAERPTTIRDVVCIDTSFPGFAAALRSLGAHVEEVAGAAG